MKYFKAIFNITLILITLFSCDIITEPIEVPPNDNPLDIENPDYIPPLVTLFEALDGMTLTTDYINVTWEGNVDSCSFSYALDDEAWSEWSMSTSLTISYLNEGDHTFQVKAKFPTGDEQETPTRIDFTVNAVQGPALWYKNKYVSTSVNSVFEVRIMLEEADNLGLLKFDILFDVDKLDFLSIEKSYNTQLDNLISLNKVKSDGSVEVYLGVENGTNTGISGSYDIYTVQFKALERGISNIEFINSDMRTLDDGVITVNQMDACRVEVE